MKTRLHALKALRMKIALSFRLPPDPQFRIGEPATSLHNPGYPLWAAKLLDRFQFQEGDLKSAAASLEISPSRLARLLRRDPVLWTEANRIRAAFSLPPLKSME